jgi:rod shape determining protein RodA
VTLLGRAQPSRRGVRGATRRALERDGFLRRLDGVLLVAVALLLIIGTLLVWSATRQWYASAGLDPNYYLKRHLLNIFIGLILALGAALIDYRLLRAYTPFLWGAAVLGLMAVLTPFGTIVNGSRSWITIPGGLQIQPAELAKVAIVVGMAMVLAEKRDGERDPRNIDVFQALIIAAIPLVLILAQPDLGTILVISGAVLTIIAVAGAKSRWVIGLILLAIIGLSSAVKLGMVEEYQIKRLQSFVDPSADPQRSGYQLKQARITIGSGGMLGKGLFNGPQTNGRFVPEQQTDFIFTVAGEELGFVGSAGIIGLFGIVLWRAGRIARRSQDLFGRLVAVGIMSWLAFQTFENIGMSIGLVPMTGVPLPFISYGGSSMFATLIAVGLLQNVHARR